MLTGHKKKKVRLFEFDHSWEDLWCNALHAPFLWIKEMDFGCPLVCKKCFHWLAACKEITDEMGERVLVFSNHSDELCRLLCLQHVNVRSGQKTAFVNSKLCQQILSYHLTFILRLLITKHYLELDKVSKSIHLVDVHSCLSHDKQSPGLSHDSANPKRHGQQGREARSLLWCHFERAECGQLGSSGVAALVEDQLALLLCAKFSQLQATTGNFKKRVNLFENSACLVTAQSTSLRNCSRDSGKDCLNFHVSRHDKKYNDSDGHNSKPHPSRFELHRKDLGKQLQVVVQNLQK